MIHTTRSCHDCNYNGLPQNPPSELSPQTTQPKTAHIRRYITPAVEGPSTSCEINSLGAFITHAACTPPSPQISTRDGDCCGTALHIRPLMPAQLTLGTGFGPTPTATSKEDASVYFGSILHFHLTTLVHFMS